MAQTDWRVAGEWIENPTGAFGRACDFGARPAHGNCQGRFGAVVETPQAVAA